MLSQQEYDRALRDPVSFIKKHYEDTNITMHYIADNSAVPYNTVKSFMNGSRPKTRVETLVKLVKFTLWHKDHIARHRRRLKK